MKRIDLILDVDTGVDDALALLLAVRHPAMRLRAVTCVAGNAGLDDVVRNTLGVLAVAGATGIPVGAGAERPLIAPHRPSVLFHGAGGLGGIAVPQARRRALPHAIDLMRKTIAASRAPLTLVALGPLTNVALLVRTAPHLARRLARIVFMGGSAHVGNATPIAEFNAWGDPEALAIVLSAGCPITMYGLDVFFDAIVTPADVRALADSPKRAPRRAASSRSHRIRHCSRCPRRSYLEPEKK